MYSILFLCTGNSARSILSEAILNHYWGDRFLGLSAGSHPGGQVNPAAIACLQKHGIDTSSLRSKSWDEFESKDAIDLVVTVCDNAAAEVCPIWPGNPAKLHWSLPDPVHLPSPEIDEAFEQLFIDIKHRLSELVKTR